MLKLKICNFPFLKPCRGYIFVNKIDIEYYNPRRGFIIFLLHPGISEFFKKIQLLLLILYEDRFPRINFITIIKHLRCLTLFSRKPRRGYIFVKKIYIVHFNPSRGFIIFHCCPDNSELFKKFDTTSRSSTRICFPVSILIQ